MTTQNYANHRQYVPMFHFVLLGLILLTLIGSLVNLVKSLGDHQRLYSAALIVVIMVCLVILFFFCRVFALKAQDRAIRAEENLRHFVLTGKLLDASLTVHQIVALRFAPDAEFVELASRASRERMPPDAIKRAIKNWRADTYRV
jgi:L-cystine uptake protein TcyP (sodium:dicarboxylate symporter family)